MALSARPEASLAVSRPCLVEEGFDDRTLAGVTPAIMRF
jgi:hypothetical protein